ncbi:threonine-phosphate decarboxylase CobD [Brevibacillus marinus]|uniref:threonine-phosphate decarboxylase CobD n=1 Tax=Brevibacillus marinus TaxID=2496837 RepID=UPI001F497EA7|nr:threonine-phosphate decarboxylase CobD [Brevibacillus marinus]
MSSKRNHAQQWLEKYGHGGDVWSAQEMFNISPADLVDYSANINPLGPPPGLADELIRRMPEIARYPDPTSRRLRAKLADKLGVKPEQILVGNGAAECIQLAVDSLRVRRVGIIHPTFSEYEAAARKAGCQIVSTVVGAAQSFLPAASDLLPMLNEIDLLFLGYPNNPTGNLLERPLLFALAEACQQKQVYLAVDEAFLDFLPDAGERSLLPELPRLPHVLLFRSLTKLYAIPGLRLGYVIADARLIDRLRSRQIPWSVNGLAQAAGEWLLDQEAFVRLSQQYIQDARERMAAALSAWPGVTVFPSRVNYLLVHIAGVSAIQLQRRMAERGFLIRNCAMYPGLDEGYIRLAVRKREQNEQMLAHLQAAIGECRMREGESG